PRYVLSLSHTAEHWDEIAAALAPQGEVCFIDIPTGLDFLKLRRKAASVHMEMMMVRVIHPGQDMIAIHRLPTEVAATVDTGLPPELVLVEEFGVSRHTVRAALQRLVADGLIERRAGLGTTVTKRAAGGSWLIGSLDELLEYQVDQIELLDARLVPGKDFPQ